MAEKQCGSARLSTWPAVTQPGVDQPLLAHYTVGCFIRSPAGGHVTVPILPVPGTMLRLLWRELFYLHHVPMDSTSTRSRLYVRSGSLLHCLNIVCPVATANRPRVSRRTGGEGGSISKTPSAVGGKACAWGRRVLTGVIFRYERQCYLQVSSSFVFLS